MRSEGKRLPARALGCELSGPAMTPGTLESVESRFRALVLDGFGMAEASYITASGPTAADRRLGSCGRPALGTVRVIDPGGEDLPPGLSGEVVIRGPTLFPGYLDDPEANAAAFLPGGWFRAGDVGYLDQDGFLFLTGRLNELINRGGEKIAPVEIDRVLQTHPLSPRQRRSQCPIRAWAKISSPLSS